MLREKFKWRPHKNESTDAGHGGGPTRSSVEVPVMGIERRGCLSSEKVIANRETGMSIDLARRLAIVRWQEDGWDEPCKSRGLRTVLWAAGGEIPPADPAVKGDLHSYRDLSFCDLTPA